MLQPDSGKSPTSVLESKKQRKHKCSNSTSIWLHTGFRKSPQKPKQHWYLDATVSDTKMTACKHYREKNVKPHWYLDKNDLPRAAEKKLIASGICIFLVHTTKPPKTKQLHTGSPPAKIALIPDPQSLGLFSSKPLQKGTKKEKEKKRKKANPHWYLRFAQNCSRTWE